MSVAGLGGEGCAMRSETMTNARKTTRSATTPAAPYFTNRIVIPSPVFADPSQKVGNCNWRCPAQNDAMTEDHALLAETAAKALRELPDDFAQAWKRIADAGFALLLVPEKAGGFGGGWEDANIVLRAAGAA